jgi:hypothetical protein
LPPILKVLEKDPSSQASFAIASGWLRDCLKNHESCKPPAEIQKPPKRLMNVGNESRDPFLVEVSRGSQDVEWVSLSYCWGKKTPEQEKDAIKLTMNTMSMLKNGISMDRFDPTIRDAILVTRALGFSYIWIDALCIIQKVGIGEWNEEAIREWNEEATREWNEEASRMNEIYGGSTVTLVVASSTSAMKGFLKEREVQYVPILWPINPVSDSTDNEPLAKVFLSLERDKNEDELKGPWSNRGWTMQEGLLPNRLLHYTSSQMIWKCCEKQTFERGVTKSVQDEVAKTLKYDDDISFGSGWLWRLDTFMQFKKFPDYLPSNPNYPLISNQEIFRLWYHLIEDYTQREFTCKNDRLVAFSGLARIFGNMIRSHEYVAGLWKSDLIRGLIWHTEGAKLVPRQSPNSVFPSWSWASSGHQLVKNSMSSEDFSALSRVEDALVSLVDPRDPFGVVNGGTVTITGPLKKISRLYDKEWRSAERPISKFERHLSETVEEQSPGDVEDKYVSPPGGHFAALQMIRTYITLDLLVLEATGEVLNGINVYRRVGVHTLLGFHKRDFASPELGAIMEGFKNSQRAKLGPLRKEAEPQKGCSEVVAELESDPWKKETVTIV